MTRRPRPKIVTLTDAAAARVKEIVAKGDKPYLRVGVVNGGCAGMEYTLDYAVGPAQFDELVEDKEVKILVAADAVLVKHAVDQLLKILRAPGHGLGSFQHHGIASHQRIGKAGEDVLERVVPGHDAGHHTQGAVFDAAFFVQQRPAHADFFGF